ncbi:unnamed protein product [Bathycoccus prasinos]
MSREQHRSREKLDYFFFGKDAYPLELLLPQGRCTNTAENILGGEEGGGTNFICAIRDKTTGAIVAHVYQQHTSQLVEALERHGEGEVSTTQPLSVALCEPGSFAIFDKGVAEGSLRLRWCRRRDDVETRCIPERRCRFQLDVKLSTFL